MQMTGAQILVQALIEQGIDTVFGFPGGYVIDIFDALHSRADELRLIVPAHEQGGAHAADGYARISGKTGVMIATSGPGATNLVTGIANAFMDSVPLVCITGNVPLKPVNMMGRDSFQEIDIRGVTLPITKHSFLVTDIAKLAETAREAFVIAHSGRPGPVLIDIPKDVAAGVCEYVSPGRFAPRPQKPPSDDKLRQAAELLKKSERPLLFCGGGVVTANASKELTALAERLDIPVAASLMGLTALPAGHPLALGMIGMHGTPAANVAGERCDLMIAAGTRFSDRVAGDRRRFAPNAKIIHIDIDPSEFDKNVICDLPIQGDAKAALAGLFSLLPPLDHAGWLREIAAFKTRHPMPEGKAARYLRAVRAAAGSDAVIVTDVGQHQMWTAQHYPFEQPRGFITSGGLGAMGFGLGAAVGAKAAAPNRPVVLITGDGSFHMNMAELAAAQTENLPVIVILFNNGVLGMVRQWQSMFHQNRHAATTTNRQTDYVKLAEAFGALGFRAENEEQFEKALDQALLSGKTCVIDCAIGPDDMVFPMIPPGKSGKDIVYE
ncbi:MAG: biosynthetic-type acetolactate synthase large subunit [Oscillospiraceae bacterium]|jgi:acetolactate synthase-1/2/3 large subunit|nr:biosynthetic-type acetolactate synthase large subunit [Oscillospiraceae bacterium]